MRTPSRRERRTPKPRAGTGNVADTMTAARNGPGTFGRCSTSARELCLRFVSATIREKRRKNKARSQITFEQSENQKCDFVHRLLACVPAAWAIEVAGQGSSQRKLERVSRVYGDFP